MIKNIYAITLVENGVEMAIGTISLFEYANFGTDSDRYTIRRKDLDKQEGATVLQHVLQVPNNDVFRYIRDLYKQNNASKKEQ